MQVSLWNLSNVQRLPSDDPVVAYRLRVKNNRARRQLLVTCELYVDHTFLFIIEMPTLLVINSQFEHNVLSRCNYDLIKLFRAVLFSALYEFVFIIFGCRSYVRRILSHIIPVSIRIIYTVILQVSV